MKQPDSTDAMAAANRGWRHSAGWWFDNSITIALASPPSVGAQGIRLP
jgi:hypothetical protein